MSPCSLDVERGIVGLRRVAFLLERELAETHRVKALRTAANTIESLADGDAAGRVERGTLTDLPGVGAKTSSVRGDDASDGHRDL